MYLDQREISNVSNLEPFKRYQYFIKKIADFEELWTIVDSNGDIALAEIKDNVLISFWTAEEFIYSNLEGSWEDCNPFKITLNDLKEKIVDEISKGNYLLNIFPVNGKSGFIVNLEEFIRDLNEELENYE